MEWIARIISLLALFAFPSLLFAQEEEKIDPKEVRKKYAEEHTVISFGYTSTRLSGNLDYMTDRTPSTGVFFEVRGYVAPRYRPAPGFIRIRAAFDTWGDREIQGLIQSERAKIRRYLVTIGMAKYVFGDNLFSGGYGSFEIGWRHLEAETTYLPLAKIKYSNPVMRAVVGWDIWRFSVEGGLEATLDSKKTMANEADLDNTDSRNRWTNKGSEPDIVFSLGYRF